nr:amidohydrolase family protein [Pigmentiphaga sp.]
MRSETSTGGAGPSSTPSSRGRTNTRASRPWICGCRCRTTSTSRRPCSSGIGDQAVPSREAVLRLMTINNARLTDEEAIKGSIEAGKLADFVVLSADYLSIPASEVQHLKALATYVGGREVYRSAAF